MVFRTGQGSQHQAWRGPGGAALTCCCGDPKGESWRGLTTSLHFLVDEEEEEVVVEKEDDMAPEGGGAGAGRAQVSEGGEEGRGEGGDKRLVARSYRGPISGGPR